MPIRPGLSLEARWTPVPSASGRGRGLALRDRTLLGRARLGLSLSAGPGLLGHRTGALADLHHHRIRRRSLRLWRIPAGPNLVRGLRLAPDVDLAARQLRGQAGVLALLPDGERELVVGH